MNRHPLLPLAGVVGHQAVQRGLPTVSTASGQGDVTVRAGKQIDLEGADDQHGEQEEQEDDNGSLDAGLSPGGTAV